MQLILLGFSFLTARVADTANAMNCFDSIALLDDNAPQALDTCNNFVNYISDDTCFMPAFESNADRTAWLQRLMSLGCEIPVLTHPDANVAPGAQLIRGTVIEAGATIGSGCLLKMGCYVEHGAMIGESCTLEEGVVVRSGAVIPAGTSIHRHAVVDDSCVD